MSKLAQLREKRNAAAKKAHDLNNKYPADQRMPAAEAAQLDGFLAEVEAIDAEIAREQRIAQVAGENPAAQHDAAVLAAMQAGPGQTAESAALRAMLSGSLSAAQREAMSARTSPEIRAAMSTTAGAEGGYTVATEFNKTLIQAMKAAYAVRNVASNIQTSTGAQMLFPTADSTQEEGEIVGQNSGVGTSETTFGQA